MLTETGRVVAVEQGGLWVETIRQSTCGSCSAQKGCGHGLLNQIGNGRSNYLRVLLGEQSAENFRVDDQVDIAIPEQVVLRGSFIVYMLPILLSLTGTGLASRLFEGGDFLSVLGMLCGFALGIVIVRWHASVYKNDSELQPQVLGRIKSIDLVDALHLV